MGKEMPGIAAQVHVLSNQVLAIEVANANFSPRIAALESTAHSAMTSPEWDGIVTSAAGPCEQSPRLCTGVDMSTPRKAATVLGVGPASTPPLPNAGRFATSVGTGAGAPRATWSESNGLVDSARYPSDNISSGAAQMSNGPLIGLETASKSPTGVTGSGDGYPLLHPPSLTNQPCSVANAVMQPRVGTSLTLPPAQSLAGSLRLDHLAGSLRTERGCRRSTSPTEQQVPSVPVPSQTRNLTTALSAHNGRPPSPMKQAQLPFGSGSGPAFRTTPTPAQPQCSAASQPSVLQHGSNLGPAAVAAVSATCAATGAVSPGPLIVPSMDAANPFPVGGCGRPCRQVSPGARIHKPPMLGQQWASGAGAGTIGTVPVLNMLAAPFEVL